MLSENELKKRIQEEFSKTTQYTGHYWNEIRVLVINGDDVKATYAFMRHCDKYDKEYWIMNPLFETKYAIFVNSETGEKLFTKVDTDNEQTFFFSGLVESDIDVIVALYKDFKSVAPVQELPHSNYPVFSFSNKKTVALDLKKVGNGWEMGWIH